MGHMCHMPVVEVDIKTGQVSFLDYVAVHDCGTMVNPMTVDGHVQRWHRAGHSARLCSEQFEYDKKRPAAANLVSGLSDAARP